MNELESISKKPRKLPKILLVLGALTLLVIGGVYFAANRFATPDRLVREIENNLNCRAEVQTVSYRFPAALKVTGLKLAPRDSVADAGTPFSKREKIVSTDAITIPNADLQASLGSIPSGKLELTKVLIFDPVIEFSIDQEGELSISKFFEEPEIVAGEIDKDAVRKNQERREKVEKPAREDLDRSQISPSLELLQIVGGKIIAHATATNSIIELNDLKVTVNDFDINPAAISDHRSAKVALAATLVAHRNDRSFQWAEFFLESNGNVLLLDESGEINPEIDLQFRIKKGSKISDLPTLGRLEEIMKPLRALQIKMPMLGSALEFDDDAIMDLRLDQGTLSLEQESSISFNKNKIDLAQGSFFNSGNNDHRFDGTLRISEELSTKAVDETGDLLGKEFTTSLMGPLLNQQQITLPFLSTGNIGRPKVRSKVNMDEMKEKLIKKGGEKATEALEGILNKEDAEAVSELLRGLLKN